MATADGPLARARATLQERAEWDSLRDRLSEIAEAHNVHHGDGFAGSAEYLTAVLRR
jgi:hypothetical protein